MFTDTAMYRGTVATVQALTMGMHSSANGEEPVPSEPLILSGVIPDALAVNPEIVAARQQ